MDIASKMLELRKSKKLSQTDMAKLLKIDRSTLFRYEKGERVPDMDFLVRLAKEFDLSLDNFILDKYGDTNIDTSVLPNISGIDENNEFVPNFPEDERKKIIADLAKLPAEAIGDIKLFFEFLDAKYNK